MPSHHLKGRESPLKLWKWTPRHKQGFSAINGARSHWLSAINYTESIDSPQVRIPGSFLQIFVDQLSGVIIRWTAILHIHWNVEFRLSVINSRGEFWLSPCHRRWGVDLSKFSYMNNSMKIETWFEIASIGMSIGTRISPLIKKKTGVKKSCWNVSVKLKPPYCLQ